jgi:calcineurin-like phosphoesterase
MTLTRLSDLPPIPPGAARVAFLGDIVGKCGRALALAQVQPLRDAGVELIIANGENASGGNGITTKEAQLLLAGGIDVLTTGNHVWKHADIVAFVDKEPRVLRPANYPPHTPGKGYGLFPLAGGGSFLVVCLLGRTFLEPVDCPFRSSDALLAELGLPGPVWPPAPDAPPGGPPRIPSLVDFHAEATAEKHAVRFHLDGRVSAVLGTHTHVQTSDAEITALGTAYVTDVGMTGAYPSVIGFEPKPVLDRFRTLRPHRYVPAEGPGRVEGAVLDVDRAAGRCLAVSTIRVA